MPTISFDLTAGEATKLESVGIDKAAVIELVKKEYADRAIRATVDAEIAKIEAAEQAKQSAVEAVDTTIVLT